MVELEGVDSAERTASLTQAGRSHRERKYQGKTEPGASEAFDTAEAPRSPAEAANGGEGGEPRGSGSNN